MKNIDAFKIFLNDTNNSDSFILNTSSGVLHTKACADGETGCEPVKAGRRKHYHTYENAIKDEAYKSDHQDCLE